MEEDEKASQKKRKTELPRSQVDFVLVYDEEEEDKKKNAREKILRKLEKDFEIRYERDSNLDQSNSDVYVKLRCSFERLCQEAETVKLEMPLEKGIIEKTDSIFPRLGAWIDEKFVTDNEADYVSAPFSRRHYCHFKGHENKETFFRRSLRSYLTYHILITMNVDVEEIEDKKSRPCFCCIEDKNEKELKTASKTRGHNARGLKYFRLKNIFKDYFILHEDKKMFMKEFELEVVSTSVAVTGSTKEEDKQVDLESDNGVVAIRKAEEFGSKINQIVPDPGTNTNSDIQDLVGEMNSKVKQFYKFQPLWKIRNYFGEEIAFYFAWAEGLIMSLLIPAFVGLAIIIYGLVKSLLNNGANTDGILTNGTNSDGNDSKLAVILNKLRPAFDNEATPYFSILICVWGTIFLEMWKRSSARLAYEWDVNDFQASEPDRPEFRGTRTHKDPVTSAEIWYYPLRRQFFKYATSITTVIFMICLVLISMVGVITYRVIVNVNECPKYKDSECLLLTTIASSVLNAVSIVLLGRLYKWLAKLLTDWENHQKQSKHNDALAIKIFAFQFANSYASCFYIAFFIELIDLSKVIGKGDNFRDSCQGSCMSQLSFQVMALMIVKYFAKFILDVVLPKLRRLICRKGKVSPETAHDQNDYTYLKNESLKPRLEAFTLEEYTEKVIQYGYLMLFAASFPLAPLLALIANLIDIRVDAWRLLNMYRRPVSFIAQDIGVWYGILTFVNFVGVISNSFLLAFTSSWGHNYGLAGKLIIVLAVEHGVFALKYVLAYFIPDVPNSVQQAINREKFQTRELFANDDKPPNVKEHNKDR